MTSPRPKFDRAGDRHPPLPVALWNQNPAQIQEACAQVLQGFDPRQEHAFFSQISRLSHEVALELKAHDNLRREEGTLGRGAPTALDHYATYANALTAACRARLAPEGLNTAQAKVLADILASQSRLAREPGPAFRAQAKSLGETLGLSAEAAVSPNAPVPRVARQPR